MVSEAPCGYCAAEIAQWHVNAAAINDELHLPPFALLHFTISHKQVSHRKVILFDPIVSTVGKSLWWWIYPYAYKFTCVYTNVSFGISKMKKSFLLAFDLFTFCCQLIENCRNTEIRWDSDNLNVPRIRILSCHKWHFIACSPALPQSALIITILLLPPQPTACSNGSKDKTIPRSIYPLHEDCLAVQPVETLRYSTQ